jgi:hypothetical protein
MTEMWLARAFQLLVHLLFFVIIAIPLGVLLGCVLWCFTLAMLPIEWLDKQPYYNIPDWVRMLRKEIEREK